VFYVPAGLDSGIPESQDYRVSAGNLGLSFEPHAPAVDNDDRRPYRRVEGTTLVDQVSAGAGEAILVRFPLGLLSPLQLTIALSRKASAVCACKLVGLFQRSTRFGVGHGLCCGIVGSRLSQVRLILYGR